MIKKQFTLYLENKPGSLSNVAEKLAASKINIEGISVSASTDVGLVQLVTGNATETEKILTSSHVAFTVQDIALLSLTNKPGSLAEVAAKLSNAGVNINYVYATACDCGEDCKCKCNVVISAPDLKKVEAVWERIS